MEYLERNSYTKICMYASFKRVSRKKKVGVSTWQWLLTNIIKYVDIHINFSLKFVKRRLKSKYTNKNDKLK